MKNTTLSNLIKTLIASCLFISIIIISKQYVFEKLFFYAFNGNEIYKYFQAAFMIFFQISIYFIVFKIIEKRPVKELSRYHAFRHLAIGFLISIGTLLIVMAVLYLLGVLSFERTGNPYLSTSIKLLIFFSLFALFEELVFRGIIYNHLQKVLGMNISIVVASCIFALAHVSNTNASLNSFIAIFIGGAILSILYAISNNIWLPYAFHIGWNYIQGISGLNVSGVEGIDGLFKATLSGDEMMTGGSFGIEASVVTIVATCILLIILYLYRINKVYIPDKIATEKKHLQKAL